MQWQYYRGRHDYGKRHVKPTWRRAQFFHVIHDQGKRGNADN